MKTVIRVQDKDGRGMFQMCTEDNKRNKSVYYIKGLEELSERHDTLPTVYDDILINKAFDEELGYKSFDSMDYKDSKWRFSFKSITQFEKWVKREEVTILNKNGYSILKIEATNVIESEFQSIFDINSVVSVVDITNLFTN